MYKSAARFFQSFKERHGKDAFGSTKSSGAKAKKKKKKAANHPPAVSQRNVEVQNLTQNLEAQKAKEEKLRAEINRLSSDLRVQKEVNVQLRKAVESLKEEKCQLLNKVKPYEDEIRKLREELEEQRASKRQLKKQIKAYALGKSGNINPVE